MGTFKKIEVFKMESCQMWLYILFGVLSWTVCVEGQYRSPRITEHPKDVLVKKNEPTTLNCKAEGKPEPGIEWYKDGELLNNSPGNDGRRIFLPGGDLFFLSVSDGKKESDSGTYWCIARNQVGNVRSRNASLVVGVIKDDFRVLPLSTKVLVGETAIFKCQPPKGTPDPQVLWQKNGQTLDTRLASGRMSTIDGGNLVIKDVRSSDAGRYTCVAINIAGQRISPDVVLTVHQKPYFSQEPEDTVVLAGDTAMFQCEVRGMPQPEVNWYRQDTNMPAGGRAEPIDGGLRIRDARLDDEGLYFCQANNELGSVRAGARLSVYSRPKFIVRPRDHVRVGLNGMVKFECSANGNPVPTVYWRKEGSQEIFLPSSTHGRLHVTPEGILKIQGVKKDDSGIYVCSAVSGAGARDTIARLEVTSQDQLPPPIIQFGPANQTLPLTSLATIPCEVSGTPKPTIKWFKDGMELTPSSNEGDGTHLDKSNAGDSKSKTADGGRSPRIVISANGTLQISDLRATDSGQYTCVASSVSGETSATASLAVESPVNPNIAFHRTNPALLPPSPSQPAVHNETQATSITLSWTWSPNKVVIPSRIQPLLGFTIESYSPDLQSGWVTLGQRVYSASRPGEVILHNVEGLKPDTTYLFVIRAENREGFSAPSLISNPIKTRHGSRRSSSDAEVDEEEARNQLSGSDIELISAEPASSTSIRISWKVSKSSMRYIDGYYIRYRDISPDLPIKGFSILTVVAQKNHFDAYAHVIPNLRKYTLYEMFVSPFFKSVEGQPSNTKMISTLEDKPSAPPKNLLFKMMNSTAGTLEWSPLEPQQHNGILRGFRVEIRGNDSRLHAEMDFGPNITSIVLSNLTLGRSYFVRVCGYTSVGFGPYTQPTKVEMDPAFVGSSGAEQSGVATEDGSGSQFLKEMWFMILMGCLLFIFFMFVVIILYTRRKSHGKKDHISSVMVAPHTDSQFVSGKQSLWIDQRWRPTEADKDSNRSEAKLLANHHLVNGELTEATDYAEVDPQNLTTFYNTTGKGLALHPHPTTLLQLQQQQALQQAQQDLTPYATTTLIQRRPNYDPLPTNPVSLTKNMLNDSRERESDQFSSGRSKLSLGSNNFNKFKSTHASPSPSPSAPLKMMPMSARMAGCYPSPGPNRSHLVPLEHQGIPTLHHPYHNPHQHHHMANENLYHIGEIFSPNKSASATNGFSEAVYQSGDPEDSNFLPQQTLCPLIDREIQSSLPSLASDSTSCNLYAEADDVMMPGSGNGGGSIGGVHGGGGVCNISGNSGSSSSGGRPIKNSRSTSPAYSSDSFNSGKSGNKRLYNGKGSKKKFDNGCKSLERRHLAPLLPGSRNDDPSMYVRSPYSETNGFQKLGRFQRPTVSQSHLDNEYHDWQNDPSAIKLAKTLKESNA